MGNVIFYELLDPENKLKAETKDKIWSVDEYVQVELDRIYPHYHPLDGAQKPKKPKHD